jgi:acetone carboxylase gamma subunit
MNEFVELICDACGQLAEVKLTSIGTYDSNPSAYKDEQGTLIVVCPNCGKLLTCEAPDPGLA